MRPFCNDKTKIVEGGSCDIMGERRGSRGAFQSVGGDTGTDTEVPERLRGYGGTRTLATLELVTDIDLAKE